MKDQFNLQHIRPLAEDELSIFTGGGGFWYTIGHMIGSAMAEYGGCECSGNSSDLFNGYDSWYP